MDFNIDCLVCKLETAFVLLAVQNYSVGPWELDYFTVNELLFMAQCLCPAEAVREQQG